MKNASSSRQPWSKSPLMRGASDQRGTPFHYRESDFRFNDATMQAVINQYARLRDLKAAPLDELPQSGG